MKQFLIYITKIVLITILLTVVLDGLYSALFIQCKNRGKIDQIYNSEGRKYDVVILGSSRANNHFVTPMFEQKGLKAFNYGMSGSHLFETALMLKLMIERKYEIKNVILEADLNLSGIEQSEGIASRFLPYIHNSDVIKKHFQTQEHFNELYYIPFYRYIKYDSKIGFREMIFTAIHKKTNALDNLGFYPLQKHKNANMKNNIVKLNPLPHNKYYEEIKSICKANNINLITVMTPMCENVKGMDYFEKVKKAYPEIHNYENAVVENKYFSSCGHMNETGARMFTAIILKDFFNK
ncbi:hypothetical protein EV143_104240 [Flavobacterium chryseum]|uniref:hypothetical protein n=1 Tax=Flavobacterium sp. P3160 TaxID=2512113 RepID=UPI0010603905|nr:hypothetical protein [Flavobacterium sp. P3160]TDO77476.1 hypothetical protein EV143_104240 [Flavobacterium sp. P3160]